MSKKSGIKYLQHQQRRLHPSTIFMKITLLALTLTGLFWSCTPNNQYQAKDRAVDSATTPKLDTPRYSNMDGEEILRNNINPLPDVVLDNYLVSKGVKVTGNQLIVETGFSSKSVLKLNITLNQNLDYMSTLVGYEPNGQIMSLATAQITGSAGDAIVVDCAIKKEMLERVFNKVVLQ